MGDGLQSALSNRRSERMRVSSTSPRSRGETAHEMSTSNAAPAAGWGRICFGAVVGRWSLAKSVLWILPFAFLFYTARRRVEQGLRPCVNLRWDENAALKRCSTLI